VQPGATPIARSGRLQSPVRLAGRSAAKLAAHRQRAAHRGRIVRHPPGRATRLPFGTPTRTGHTAFCLGIDYSLRPRGHPPRKAASGRTSRQERAASPYSLSTRIDVPAGRMKLAQDAVLGNRAPGNTKPQRGERRGTPGWPIPRYGARHVSGTCRKRGWLGRPGGLLPRGSHRSGRAQFGHPVPQATASLCDGTPSGRPRRLAAGAASAAG